MEHKNEPPEDFTVICPICHGSMAEAELRAPGKDNTVYLEMPQGKSSHHTFRIRAFVCNKCGYIQLIAVRDQDA